MRNLFLRSSTIAVVLCNIVLAISALYLTGCPSPDQNVAGLTSLEQSSSLTKFTVNDPAILSVMAIQDKHTAELMRDKNVVGTATGLTDDGKPAIMVYLENPVGGVKGRVTMSVPSSIDGVPVVVVVTGKIKPMDAGPNHQVKQTAPVQLGTSGGWRYDLANGFCCGGTLGSLIHVGTTQYVLSNYHVFWGDIVSGGNGRIATAGDPVTQPGLIDVACNAANAQNVATLSGSGSLPAANVDVGYAQVVSGMVSSNGAILDVGTISATTVSAFVGQAVKKSGRTTGLGRASVTGLNGTIQIQYENECAGGNSFVKTFTGQLIMSNKRCVFLNGGDSGSLMVEDVATNPHAVGLLYAGSSACNRNAIAIANPIGAVLSWIGGNAGGTAQMVGQ